MDENKQESNAEGVTHTAPEVTESPVAAAAAPVESTPATPSGMNFNIRAYVGMVVVILLIAAGLIFVLEKERRIDTGFFTGIISSMEANNSVATVNGVAILKRDYDSSFNQLRDMAVAQGANVADETVVSELQTQAIDTLVNAELLRQAALEAGMTASAEAINTRFNEIRDGIGGEEALRARMAEFNVTEDSLRRDIENEILIQALFDAEVTTTPIEVSEEDVVALYNQAGGEEAGLPPLAEIRDQIVAQIQFEREQTVISEYIETLRTDAEIEVTL